MTYFICNNYDYALMKQGESSTEKYKWICRNFVVAVFSN